MHYDWLSYSREGNVLHAFLRANIQELTFHRTNHCSRLQTIRWFRRSDWKPMGLPIRLKELRTFSCFPLSQHSGFYFPPFAKANGFETTDCLECLQILNILIYGRRVCFKAGDWILCTMIGHRIPERETFRMLSFNTASGCLLFIRDYSISPCNPHGVA